MCRCRPHVAVLVAVAESARRDPIGMTCSGGCGERGQGDDDLGGTDATPGTPGKDATQVLIASRHPGAADVVRRVREQKLYYEDTHVGRATARRSASAVPAGAGR